jgi:hypothetical protein
MKYMDKENKIELDDTSKCQSCERNNGTEELHECPYNADINNDDTPCCNCCDECCHECSMDI